MLRGLLLNFCLLVTLTYGLSLTYQPVLARTWNLGLRLAFKAVMPLVLLMFTVPVAPGIIVDLRAVPVVLATLRHGTLAGVLVAVPLVLYRIWLGGSGLPVALFSVLGAVLLASLLRRRLKVDSLSFSARQRWPLLVLVFLPNGALLPVVGHDAGLIWQVYLPLLAAHVLGFLVANSILLGRFRLLHLADGFREQAQRDPLTGLLNRRQFDDDLRTLDPFDLLLLIDIDHFKRVNDTYGHPAGDEVLRTLGAALGTSLRQRDSAYRLGGEEFAILLRGAAYGDPETIAERFRTLVAGRTRGLHGSPGVTASLGIATCVPSDPRRTLARADAALYAAKHGGRDRVVVWSDDLPAPDAPNSRPETAPA